MSSKAVCPRCHAEYSGEQEWCPVDGAGLCEPEDLARIGTRFSSYEITEVIGVGGMGVVYKGLHTALKKTFAIKILNEYYGKRKSAYQEMLREAQAASRIKHPHIVDVTDFGTTEDGAAYLVMEFLEGIALSAVLLRDTRLPVPRAVEVVRQVADALDAAHQQGIVHRDLKPENVFLVQRPRTAGSTSQERSPAGAGSGLDEPLTVKLLDFGLAKVQDMGPSSRTRAGMIAGTPYYMSPEQAQNRPVDPRSDIYSLGVLFYHMVTGVLPFTGSSNVDILLAHISKPVISPRLRCNAVDEGTSHVILRCLRKDPAQRYQNMGDLCDDLKLCGALSIPPELSVVARSTVPPPEGHDNPTVSTELVGRVLGEALAAPRGGDGEEQPGTSKTLPPRPPVVSGPTISSEFVDKVLHRPAQRSQDEITGKIKIEPPVVVSDAALEHADRKGELKSDDAVVGRSPELRQMTEPVIRKTPVTLPATAASKSRGVIWATVITVCLVGGALAYIVIANRSSGGGTGTSGAAALPAGGAEQIRIRLDGLPPEARVFLDGTAVKKRPLLLARSKRTHRLVVEAAGFVSEERRFSASENQRFVFRMSPVPAKHEITPEKKPRRRVARRSSRRGQPGAKATATKKKPTVAKAVKPRPTPKATEPAVAKKTVTPKPEAKPKPKPAVAKPKPKPKLKKEHGKAKKKYNDWVVDPFGQGN